MGAAFDFIPGEYRIQFAAAAWERAACADLRRAVFCDEQRVFDGDDTDAVDIDALPIVALACIAGMADHAVGTVRIHRDPLETDTWWGSRLAVAPAFRGVAWIGSELIRHAVCTAHARGCRRFLAHVQSQNARLFHRLHWRTLDECTLHGRPHHRMQADLTHYPPRPDDGVRFVPMARAA
ncbi:MAG: GNAT family N-acetyltransferase [Burkholderiales bacterium]|nr:GNAT family N-acetyltransferase [Burkholderiales bacterium]